MQLNRFTDFGMRILMYLTQHDRALPVTIGEIATQFDVPHNHLIKVANKLSKMGWITAVRGRHGGLRLAVKPSDLKLGYVLKTLEDHDQLIDCNTPPCPLNRCCGLQSALNEGIRAFYSKMDEYTLADVTSQQTGDIIIQMHRRVSQATPSPAHI